VAKSQSVDEVDLKQQYDLFLFLDEPIASTQLEKSIQHRLFWRLPILECLRTTGGSCTFFFIDLLTSNNHHETSALLNWYRKRR
jgi:hypothetical protein